MTFSTQKSGSSLTTNQTNESFAVFDLDGSESAAKRVKQKTYIISYDSQPNVIEASVNKMRKELEKSNFVAIKIKSSGQSETQLKDFENMLYTKCLDGGLESKKSLITSRVINWWNYIYTTNSVFVIYRTVCNAMVQKRFGNGAVIGDDNIAIGL